MFRTRVVHSSACFCMALLLAVLLPRDMYHQCSHEHGIPEHSYDGRAAVGEPDECGLCDLMSPVFHPPVMMSIGPVAPDFSDRVVDPEVEPQVADKDISSVRGPPNHGPRTPVLLLDAA